MRNSVIRFIYNLLWPIGLLLFLPGYLVKMFRRGGYRRKFGQRLGFYARDLCHRLARQKSTWLHAVSVGEVGIALKLAEQLRKAQPDLDCVLTTTTTTGFSLASRSAPSWMEVMYNPLDFWPIMRRAFSVIRPVKIVLIEAEIWPNLVAEAQARHIPVALANARLSPRSERRFRRFRSFVGPTFRLLNLVCVPELKDVDRWSALGVKRERIHCTGSIKYDPAMQELLDPALPRNILREMKVDNRQIIFGGSTHPGEEQILGEIYGKLRAELPDSFLIIAPRHAERAREIQRDLERLGLRVALRGKPPDPGTAVDCLLLDSTGELQNWYTIATVVFVGKSLAVHGGQNPVEPIVAGAPVIFGAHMENFAVLANSLVKRGGAIQVHSAAELRESLTALLRDPVFRRELVVNAHQVLVAHAGATARAAKLIVDLR